MSTIALVMLPNPFLASPEMYAPLGLLYVAAVLEENGHEVWIADFRGKKALNDVNRGEFEKLAQADFVGVTACTSSEVYDAVRTAWYVQNINRDVVTVIGGPHASVRPHDFMFFDAVVVGEGEKVILDVIEGGKRGVVVGNPVKDLDGIPFPARHLLGEKAFSKTVYLGEKYGEGQKSTTVISSRGCPFICSFCAQEHGQVRYRSPENFAEEIRLLVEKHGCRHFRFVDDSFTLNKKRLKHICSLLEPLDVHYRVQTRSDLIDAEMCEWLKRSGCDELAIGVETCDNEILQLINKRETVEQHKRAIRTIKNASLLSKVYLMAGLPKESWNTIERIKQSMVDSQPDRWTLSMFCPFPGCDIERHPEKYGVKIISRDWSKYSNFSESLIETDVASKEELDEHYRVLYEFLRSEKWKV
ncbi:MAG: B12-binding domain-containing radical SAM protein [Candidatus Bathyarchaeia archaeon]